MLSVLRAAGLAALLAASGCSSVIHNSRDISKPGIDFVDARQRAVVSGKKITTTTTVVPTATGQKKTVEENLVICSEPSPDVFSVLASSFGLDVGLAPSAASDTVKIAGALSENAATIQRTQTINLLRESFFRTCERYMNDAISPAEMIVQSARDQRAMVSVLAIEQLTGSLTPPPVVISSSAMANANDSAAKVIDDLKSAKTASDAAAAKAKVDATAYETALTANKCSEIEAIKPESRSVPQNTAWADCEAKKAAAAASKTAATGALEYYTAVRTYVMNASPEGVAARGGGELLGNAPQPATAADRAEVAATVLDIVKSAYAVDEYTMLCMRTLHEAEATAPADNSPRKKLLDACLEAMKAGIAQESLIRSERAGFTAALIVRQTATAQLFDPVSSWLKSNSDLAKQMTQLELESVRINPALKGKSFFVRGTFEEAQKRFIRLGDEEQQQVSSAAQALLKQ
jgi:hypothetical protein